MPLLTRPDGHQPEDLHLSRRGALAGVLFAGYALAAASAEASPIQTDPAGLVTETVHLADSVPAFVARPDKPGRHPTVLVIHEAFGLHEYVRDVCRRFAKLGYVAIAPAFFVRIGDPAPLADLPSVMKIVNATPDAQTLGDMKAAVAFLKQQHYADVSRLGVTGFCWGGRWTWLASALLPEVKAGAAWYGFMVPTPINQMLPSPDAKPQADRLWPSDHAARMHAPVLGLYGGLDPVTKTVPAMREALAAAGAKGSEIIVYPNAAHGFHADYRASYNEVDARDAWQRLLAHFRRYGVA
nr:dienelactone hydrolase family protein [Sphingomonas sp. CDS-1]